MRTSLLVRRLTASATCVGHLERCVATVQESGVVSAGPDSEAAWLAAH